MEFVKSIILFPTLGGWCVQGVYKVCALSFAPWTRPKHHRFRDRLRLWRPVVCTSIPLCSRSKPCWFRGAWWRYFTSYALWLPGLSSRLNWNYKDAPGCYHVPGSIHESMVYMYEYIWYAQVSGSPVAYIVCMNIWMCTLRDVRCTCANMYACIYLVLIFALAVVYTTTIYCCIGIFGALRTAYFFFLFSIIAFTYQLNS